MSDQNPPFAERGAGGDFLQSADWARFQEAVGHRVVCGEQATYFEVGLPLGNYLYCPHPAINDAPAFLDDALSIAQASRALFVRVEPNAGSTRIEKQESRSENGTRSTHNSQFTIHPTLAVQPSRTLHVPLGSDDTMLAAMHEKHRYNLRLAEKHGVTARFSSDPTDVPILYELLAKTGERAAIRLHPEKYYTTMMEVLGLGIILDRKDPLGGAAPDRESSKTWIPDPVSSTISSKSRLGMTDKKEGRLTVELAFAEHEGVPVAGALLAHYGDRTVYLHGGSDYTQRNLMAPHLLHWRTMQRAAGAGRAVYDLGGIAPDDAPNHPWAGISRFKRGFGGTPVEYPLAVDLTLQPVLYQGYRFLRTFRRSIR